MAPIATVRLWESTQLRTSHSAVNLCPQLGPEATALPFEPHSLSVPTQSFLRMGKAMETSIVLRDFACVRLWKTRISINTLKVSGHIGIISIMFIFQTFSADFLPGPGAKPGILRSWEKLWMAAVSYSHNVPNRKIVLPMADEGRGTARIGSDTVA